jgi:hypothetical protein
MGSPFASLTAAGSRPRNPIDRTSSCNGAAEPAGKLKRSKSVGTNVQGRPLYPAREFVSWTNRRQHESTDLSPLIDTQLCLNRTARRTLTYLIRYGGMASIARFGAAPESGGPFHRGQTVVIESERGVELGEVLIGFDEPSRPEENDGGETHQNDDGDSVVISTSKSTTGQTRVLRAAGSEDLARAVQINDLRPVRFAECQRIIEEEGWPWEIVDIEPLLDGNATVLHYLGPQPHDAALVRARFRVACDFDVLLEPVGGETDDVESEDAAAGEEHGCGSGGSCGSCGRGAEETGGRTVAARQSCVPENGGTAVASHGGCDSCGVRRLMAARR